jgi:hypothetical protein
MRQAKITALRTLARRGDHLLVQAIERPRSKGSTGAGYCEKESRLARLLEWLRCYRLLVVPKAAAKSDCSRYDDGASYQNAHVSPPPISRTAKGQSFNQNDVTQKQQVPRNRSLSPLAQNSTQKFSSMGASRFFQTVLNVDFD